MPPPPQTFVVINQFRGGLLSTARMRGEIVAAMIATQRVVERDIRNITDTWRHKPKFSSYFRYAGGDASLVTIVDDDIFAYLNAGTQVRHAQMTRNFSPKSAVRYVGSFPGSGGVAFVSKELNLPGIEAREWTDEVAANRTAYLQNAINNAILNGLASHGGP